MPRQTLPYRYWTDADDTTLETLLLNGQTHAKIATTMGRTEVAVNHRASRLGIQGTRQSSRWLPLFEAGLTALEIAARLNVKLNSVWLAKWRLKRAGFKLPITRVGRTKGTST